MKDNGFIGLSAKREGNMPVDLSEPPEESYPSLYLSDIEGIESLPEEGEAVIRYKRRSITETEREGKESCSVELEIQAIKPSGKKTPDSHRKPADSEMEDAIDEGLDRAEKKED